MEQNAPSNLITFDREKYREFNTFVDCNGILVDINGVKIQNLDGGNSGHWLWHPDMNLYSYPRHDIEFIAAVDFEAARGHNAPFQPYFHRERQIYVDFQGRSIGDNHPLHAFILGSNPQGGGWPEFSGELAEEEEDIFGTVTVAGEAIETPDFDMSDIQPVGSDNREAPSNTAGQPSNPQQMQGAQWAAQMQQLYHAAFPERVRLIPNNGGTTWLCGLHAIQDSWQAQGQHLSLPHWRDQDFDHLHHVLQHGQAAQSMQQYGTNPNLVNNFAYDHLVAGLNEWAMAVYGAPIQLALARGPATAPQLEILRIGNFDPDNTPILWIHFDESEPNQGHYEGMQRYAAASWRDDDDAIRVNRRSAMGKIPQVGKRWAICSIKKTEEQMNAGEKTAYKATELQIADANIKHQFQSYDEVLALDRFTETLADRPEEWCTCPGNDETFPTTALRRGAFVTELFNGIMDFSSYIEWRDNLLPYEQASVIKEEEEAKKAEDANRRIVQDYAEWMLVEGIPNKAGTIATTKTKQITVARMLHIPSKVADFLPSRVQQMNHILGQHGFNHETAERMAWHLFEACVESQQGRMNISGFSLGFGWEQYRTLQDRITAVARVLLCCKQLIKEIRGLDDFRVLAAYPQGLFDKAEDLRRTAFISGEDNILRRLQKKRTTVDGLKKEFEALCNSGQRLDYWLPDDDGEAKYEDSSDNNMVDGEAPETEQGGSSKNKSKSEGKAKSKPTKTAKTSPPAKPATSAKSKSARRTPPRSARTSVSVDPSTVRTTRAMNAARRAAMSDSDEEMGYA